MKRRNFLAALAGLGAMVGIKPKEKRGGELELQGGSGTQIGSGENFKFTFPKNDPELGQVLTTDDDGQLKWITITGTSQNNTDAKIVFREMVSTTSD